MPRLVMALLSFVILYNWRGDGAGPSQSAIAQRQAMSFIAERLAGAHVPEAQLGAIFGFALLVAGAMGFFLHLALTDRAFGPRGNGLLCYLGGACATMLWVLLAPRAYVGNPSSLMMVVSVGAVGFLLACAAAKTAAVARLDEIATGVRPSREKNALPAHRLAAAARRRA